LTDSRSDGLPTICGGLGPQKTERELATLE
jgi:hypothetical protein